MKTAVFTSTITPELLAWMHKEAMATDSTRREILEAALEQYRVKTLRARMAADFKAMAHDPEIHEIAELGLVDYAKELKKYD